HPLPLDSPHANGRHRLIEGDPAQVQRHRSTREGDDVGVVLLVGRHHVRKDLRLVEEALREERAQRPVDQTSGENFLVRRAALTLDVPAWNLPCGVRLFAIFDGQREEGKVGGVVLRRRRTENHRLAELDQTRSICLAGHSPRFDRQGPSRELSLDLYHFSSALPLSSQWGIRYSAVPPPDGPPFRKKQKNRRTAHTVRRRLRIAQRRSPRSAIRARYCSRSVFRR